MPKHDDAISLRQMLDHGREAVALIQGSTRDVLDQERVTTLALVHLLQIVGEAAGRTSPALQQAHPEIPWPQIIALRNRLIHGYDTIDLDRLWLILTPDLPQLIAQLESMQP